MYIGDKIILPVNRLQESAESELACYMVKGISMTNPGFVLATLLCCCCYAFSALVSDNVRVDTSTNINSLVDAFMNMQEQLKKVESRLEVLEEENKLQSQEIVQLKEKLSNTERNTDSLEASSDSQEEKSDDTIFDQQDVKSDDTTSDQTVEHSIEKGMPQNRIRRADTLMDVAFFAKLKTEIHNLGINQDIVFDEIVTNVGNAYNSHHGVFVAPVSGLYVFSTTMLTYQHDQQHFGFALNGNPITIMWTNGQESLGDSDSQTIVLHLNKGDDVSVKATFDSGSGLYGGGHSIFSGFLLPSVQNSAEIIG